MKKGDIVRIINKSGLPIGRFYIVHKVVGRVVYVKNSIYLTPFRLSIFQNVHVYTKCIALVSHADFEDLNKSYCNTYYHVVSKQWDKIYDKQPDIIEFMCVGVQQHIFYKTDTIHRKIIKGQPCIRVYFQQRIFRSIYE